MSGRTYMLKNGKRVFSCGCIQQSVDDIGFKFGNTPYCKKHPDSSVVGILIKCQNPECGKEEVRVPSAIRVKYCKECSDRMRKRGKYKPKSKKSRTIITPEDTEFIKSHPWMSPEEMASELNYNINSIKRKRKDLNIDPEFKGYPQRIVDDFLEAHKDVYERPWLYNKEEEEV